MSSTCGASGHSGLEAWRKMAADWFSSLDTEQVAVDIADVQTIMAQDVAVAHVFVTYKSRL